MERKEFLNISGRIALLAGLGVLAGIGVNRSSQNEDSCNVSLCKNCGKYNNCNLPKKQKIEK